MMVESQICTYVYTIHKTLVSFFIINSVLSTFMTSIVYRKVTSNLTNIL